MFGKHGKIYVIKLIQTIQTQLASLKKIIQMSIFQDELAFISPFDKIAIKVLCVHYFIYYSIP